VLLATSRSFLVEVLSPTSDVPVAAWWAVVWALFLFEGRLAAFGAGVATGLAILTRPNLVLVAAVPGGWLIWRAVRRRLELSRVLLFLAGSIPSCILVAAVNW